MNLFPLPDIIRDSTLGQLVRFLSRDKIFQYPEERDAFEFLHLFKGTSRPSTFPDKKYEATETNGLHPSVPQTADELSNETVQATQSVGHKIEKTPSKRTADGDILVDWYNDQDPENPHNWSHLKRAVVALQIDLYSFAVYAGSSIIVPAEGYLKEQYHTSTITVELSLALYVLGYGMGPLLWSPLSEIPRLGRNVPYIATFTIFILLTIPAALVDNMPGLLVLRFLQGFFGSPCLATGGATMQDMYSLAYLPFSMAIWVSFMFCGPALAPVFSGFSVPVKGWRWSMWELLWLCAPVFVAWLFFLPETNAHTILGRRAARLRKRTGNRRIRTQAELDRAGLTPWVVFVNALIKPMEIMFKDPAIAFTNLYTALCYGIYYSFFEVFPLVYGPMYGFNLGETGLAFLANVVGCFLGMGLYFAYVYWRLIPRIMAHPKGIFGLPPEWRLRPALGLVTLLPVALVGFGWSSTPHVHWVVGSLCLALYSGSVFVVLQCVFVYVPSSYPQYAASLFASNDFCRSVFAFGAVLFGTPMYTNLGVGKGSTLLAGLSVLGIIGMWVLYLYGAKLRARSTFAVG